MLAELEVKYFCFSIISLPLTTAICEAEGRKEINDRKVRDTLVGEIVLMGTDWNYC